MLRPLPLALGLRYLRVRRRSRFVSVVALVAILGVALGVAALIVVLSVMNGMRDFQVNRILALGAQVTVLARNHKALPEVAKLLAGLRKQPDVRTGMAYAAREVVLSRNGTLAGVRLKGVLPRREQAMTSIGQHMLIGSLGQLASTPYGIVLGRDLALRLNVVPGQRVMVVLPRGLITPVGFVPRLRRFRVVGVFAVGNARYDAGLALTARRYALRLFGLSAPNELVLELKHPFQADTVAARLRSSLPPGLKVRTWQEQHQALFAALANEQRMMFLLVGLAVLIAAFNVLGVLTVLVADKRAEIAVLATMGLTPRALLATFLSLGVAIGSLGIMLGLGAGLALAFNINSVVEQVGRWLGHPLLTMGGVEVIGLPARVDPAQVGGIVAMAAVLVLAAAWLPARRAARLRVIEALADG